MTQELVLVPDNLPPAMFDLAIAAASEKAASLKRLVEQQKLYVQMGNNKHLRVEAWETIGRGYGYTAKSTISELYRNADGTIIGVKATATVVDQNGVSVGGADSVCFADEDGKSSQSVAQLAGMAQTRAVSRAYKQVLSWVVVLAGYSATPAEEMHGELARQTAASSDRPDYYCQEHKAEWFKRGKMRSFAHPIGDSTEWCHMPASKSDAVPADPAVTLGLADDVQEAAPEPKQGAQATTESQAPHFTTFADQLKHHGLTLNDVAACLPKGVAWDKATREQRKAAFARAVEAKHEN